MKALRTRILAAIAGVLAVAVLALWLWRAGPLPPERAPARSPLPLPPPVVDARPELPASKAAIEPPPPWSAAPAPVRSAPAEARGAAGAADARQAQLQSIEQRLVEIVASGQGADLQKLDHLLGEVERVQGGSTLAGVKIDVLRHNLTIARQMQALANEIQQLAGPGAKADPAQLQAKTAKLIELQAQLRTDVLVAAPPPAGT